MKKNKSLKNIDELNDQLEYMKAKNDFLKEKYPDIQTKLNKVLIPLNGIYSSEQINTTYTNLDFVKRYSSLIVMPYALVEFKYKDRPSENIKIHSNPATSRLAYITYGYISEDTVVNGITHKTKKGVRQINFSKVAVNFKNNNFSDFMVNECRLKILELIQKYPNYQLNTKHLDERIKKLLAFT